jgi:hypothetical protein
MQQHATDSDHDSDPESGGTTWDYPTLRNTNNVGIEQIANEEAGGHPLDGEHWQRIEKAVNDTADNIATIRVSLSYHS